MLRTDKTDDKKKISFIFYMNNIGVFYKYSNLALKNIYLTNLRLYKNGFTSFSRCNCWHLSL